MSSAPPLPSPPPHSSPPSLLPSPVTCHFPSLPSLPYPSPPSFTSLSLPLLPFLPLPPLPLKRGSWGPPPENFEILDCCRGVLAHSGMQKRSWQMCAFLGRATKKIGTSLGGGGRSPPSPPVDPPLMRGALKMPRTVADTAPSGLFISDVEPCRLDTSPSV